MDYLTDKVLSRKVTLFGQSYITPDSRVVVTVHREKTSVTLIVQHTTGTVFRVFRSLRRNAVTPG